MEDGGFDGASGVEGGGYPLEWTRLADSPTIPFEAVESKRFLGDRTSLRRRGWPLALECARVECWLDDEAGLQAAGLRIRP